MISKRNIITARTRIGAAATIFVVLMVGTALPALSQESDDVTVTALHAIPGEKDFPADVYINGNLAISGFLRMEKTDPFTVAPGPITVAIYPNGADPATTDPAIEDTLDLPPASNLVIVAQLTDTGEPILALYINPVEPLDPGQARLVFRQTSGFASVDVLANGNALFESVDSLDEAVLELPAGAYDLDVVPAGGGESLISGNVTLAEGVLTAVYAIPTLEGTYEFAIQTLFGLAQQPEGVPTGSGGFAAEPTSDLPVAVAVATFLGLMSIAGLVVSRQETG